jgi:superfamily II DNA or RNA helicase
VNRIADQATRTNQVINARTVPTEENDEPWMELPSGKKTYKPAIQDLPNEISVIIANRLFIKMTSLPKVLLNQLRQLAAFQNPEFYKRQRLRLSTHITPRVICCAETSGEYLALPRGCIHDVRTLLEEYGIILNLEDKRFPGRRSAFKFSGDLTQVQKTAVKRILENDIGILVAPPGTGKTVLAIAAIEKRKTNTLILVHRKPLLDQWRTQLAAFLGVSIKEIGQIGSGKNKATGILDVAMLQSLERKGKVDDRIADYGFIIVDECHHIGAVFFEHVLTQVKAKYVLGLTATPYRRDGHQPIIHMQCGPVIHQIKRVHNEEEISAQIIPRKTEIEYAWTSDSKIYDLWVVLIKDEQRNAMIAEDVLKVIDEGRFPLILTERKEHLEILAKMLAGKIENLAVLHGGIKVKRRKEVLKALQAASDSTAKAILATGSYIGEGFDEPRLDTLFITMPVSFKGKIVQYVGRLQRKYAGKHSGRVYDYVDQKVTVLSAMYKKRLKTYSNLGFEVSGTASWRTDGGY